MQTHFRRIAFHWSLINILFEGGGIQFLVSCRTKEESFYEQETC